MLYSEGWPMRLAFFRFYLKDGLYKKDDQNL